MMSVLTSQGGTVRSRAQNAARSMKKKRGNTREGLLKTNKESTKIGNVSFRKPGERWDRTDGQRFRVKPEKKSQPKKKDRMTFSRGKRESNRELKGAVERPIIH